MEVVFSIIFSNMVISDDNKYGPIGVVFALMSWLIAIGVVIILGAVAGSCGGNEVYRSGPPSRNCGGTDAGPRGSVRRRAEAPAERLRPGKAGTAGE